MIEPKIVEGVVAVLPATILAASGVFYLATRRDEGGEAPKIASSSALAALMLSAAGGTYSFFTANWPAWDVVSLTMLLLVLFIGWVVLRFAETQLRGEQGRRRFLGWLSLTLAAVSVLVTARDLFALAAGWVLASLCLQRLLLFYPDRAAARRAAAKKFVVARAGDAALIGACAALAIAYGTTHIPDIVSQAGRGPGGTAAVVAAALLALAAVMKSAQFPVHGWLTESIDTPTPVSALLHAGVINAGGFLLIRFADVMLLSPTALACLAMVGGLTALFGALVMLTQSAVKTSLAWSTVGQMGFMILECGLGLFPLALLHIVAHSLYKAHAFLSAGQAVERVAASLRPGPVAVPGFRAAGLAFIAAFCAYLGIGLLLGLAHKPPQAVALGAILVFGVAYMLAQGFAGAAPRGLTLRTSCYAVAATGGYFLLQDAATWLTRDALPPPPAAGALEWTVIVLALVSFGFVAFLQSVFPLWSNHPAAAGLRVHLANGLYVNALTDRLLKSWFAKASTPNKELAR